MWLLYHCDGSTLQRRSVANIDKRRHSSKQMKKALSAVTQPWIKPCWCSCFDTVLVPYRYCIVLSPWPHYCRVRTRSVSCMYIKGVSRLSRPIINQHTIQLLYSYNNKPLFSLYDAWFMHLHMFCPPVGRGHLLTGRGGVWVFLLKYLIWCSRHWDLETPRPFARLF